MMFDKNEDGVLDFTEFIQGLDLIERGSFEEKCQFCLKFRFRRHSCGSNLRNCSNIEATVMAWWPSVRALHVRIVYEKSHVQ